MLVFCRYNQYLLLICLFFVGVLLKDYGMATRFVPKSYKQHQVGPSVQGLSVYLRSAIVTSLIYASSNPAQAIEMKNILSSRLLSGGVDAYRPGITESDVFYPSWFLGKWNVTSTLTDVQAPLGENAFGGRNTFDRARNDTGNALIYSSRFRLTPSGPLSMF